MLPIPLIEAHGTPRAAGRAIGEACRDAIRAVAEEAAGDAAWEGRVGASGPFRAAAGEHLPRVVDELRGVAEGSGVPLDELLVLSVEELWSEVPVPGRGCTDLAARGTATVDGHVLMGHTNDLGPTNRDRIVAIDRRVEGEPRLLTLGVGPWPSVGLNEHGLALGGNELSASDERVGVPRLLLVRELLTRPTPADALAVTLHPARASQYCNVIGHRDGTLVAVEASATAHVVIDASATGDVLAHTNHYDHPAMHRFERDPARTEGSVCRLDRARALLAGRSGPVGPADLRRWLSDHGEGEAICRHDGPAPTAFWCVLDPTAGSVRFGRGRPCAPGEQVLTV